MQNFEEQNITNSHAWLKQIDQAEIDHEKIRVTESLIADLSKSLHLEKQSKEAVVTSLALRHEATEEEIMVTLKDHIDRMVMINLIKKLDTPDTSSNPCRVDK